MQKYFNIKITFKLVVHVETVQLDSGGTNSRPFSVKNWSGKIRSPDYQPSILSPNQTYPTTDPRGVPPSKTPKPKRTSRNAPENKRGTNGVTEIGPGTTAPAVQGIEPFSGPRPVEGISLPLFDRPTFGQFVLDDAVAAVPFAFVRRRVLHPVDDRRRSDRSPFNRNPFIFLLFLRSDSSLPKNKASLLIAWAHPDGRFLLAPLSVPSSLPHSCPYNAPRR